MINVYPNPANKKIIITGITQFAHLLLFDQAGKLVWQKSSVSNQGIIEIELPRLATGVYVLKIGEAVKRLVIRPQ